MIGAILVFGAMIAICALFGWCLAKYIFPEKKAIRVISAIAFTIMFFVLSVGGIVKWSDSEDTKWNNGYCDVCGGSWVFEGRYNNRFYWDCPDCGKLIITDYNFRG